MNSPTSSIGKRWRRIAQAVSMCSDLSTSSTIELFSLIMQAKKIVGGLIPLDTGMSLKYQFQLLEHLICSVTFKSRFKVVKHGALNYQVVIILS